MKQFQRHRWWETHASSRSDLPRINSCVSRYILGHGRSAAIWAFVSKREEARAAMPRVLKQLQDEPDLAAKYAAAFGEEPYLKMVWCLKLLWAELLWSGSIC